MKHSRRPHVRARMDAVLGVLRDAGGVLRAIEVAKRLDPDGDPSGYRGYARVYTDLRRLEADDQVEQVPFSQPNAVGWRPVLVEDVLDQLEAMWANPAVQRGES